MNKSNALEAFRRFWWVALLFGLGGAILGAIPEPAKTVDSSTTKYQASYAILMQTDDVNGIYNNSLTNQISIFTTLGEVPKRAAVELGQPETDGPTLASQITVTVDAQSAAVTINTTQATPDEAVNLVNAFGEQLTKFIAERQDDVRTTRLGKLDERLKKYETDLKSLQSKLADNPDDEVVKAQIDAASSQYSATAQQYDTIAADTSTLTLTELQRGAAIEITESQGLSAPKSRSTRGMLGFLLGLVVGGAVAVLLGRLDRRIRSRAHAESLFDGVVSTSIPMVAGSNTSLEVMPDRHDQLSDSYRTLRSVITFSQASLPKLEGTARARVTLVVSACAGDGKTSVAANLAAALAETGKRVVAVNADFRRPTLSKRFFDTPQSPLPYELEDLTIAPVRYLLQRTPINNLVLLDLTSVKASPGNLARATMRVLPDVMAMADAIVIDSSPVGLTAEVLDLLPMADTIVVVMRLDHTLASAATRTMELLHSLSDATFHLALVGDTTERSAYYEYDTRPTAPKKPALEKA